MIGRVFWGILATALASAIPLLAAPAADAAFPAVFDGEVACVDQGPAEGNVRFCGGSDTTVETWDGTTPIDANVALPPEPAMGPDGPYPMVMIFHGWGGSELGYGSLKPWAQAGYAVMSVSDRGWGMSCGGMDPKRLTPACADGYNHLMDTRFEVRDAQYLAGILVDDGVAIPDKLGATGGSYGGGLSMALAALKDRVALPNGSLVPWESPDGADIELAAAQPDIPWTDLAYSLTPNGHSLDYVADAPYFERGRVGVLKQSFVAGLFGLGLATSNYALPGTDPDADLINWYAQLNAGEPYDQNPAASGIAQEVMTNHSSYYIDHSQPPAPLLISNGWTDDLFPPDEAIRFYNRTRSEHPTADISLFFSDHGHQRGQNKPADAAFRRQRTEEWFDHYLKNGPAPTLGVETLTQTCPDSAPSGGPFTAPTWKAIAPGEVRLNDAAGKTVTPGGGNPAAGQAYDPISGDGACATFSGVDAPGAASYRLPAAPAGGYTLMGSPTVIADINSVGPTSQLAARLLDVDTVSGDATLVARGLYRPEVNPGTEPTRQVFQLHPNGYRFESGHVAKLELLPNDAPYGRTSNGQLPVVVSNLELRLPVLESPGDLGGGFLSNEPAQKVVPAGYELADDYLTGPPSDLDEDGVPNSEDDCPSTPGPASSNGCPVIGADSDLDGVPNSQDQCPNQAGPASNGGCPASVAAQPPNATPQQPPAGTAKKCTKRKKGTTRPSRKAKSAKSKRRCKKKSKKRR